jgi:ssDNA-binding replication factor A large subunit
MMANVYVEDESGKIKLCLWDEQIKSVTAGDIIQIKNASVATFKGEKQLRLGKTGTITVLRNEPPKAKPSSGAKAKKPAEKVVFA